MSRPVSDDTRLSNSKLINSPNPKNCRFDPILLFLLIIYRKNPVTFNNIEQANKAKLSVKASIIKTP